MHEWKNGQNRFVVKNIFALNTRIMENVNIWKNKKNREYLAGKHFVWTSNHEILEILSTKAQKLKFEPNNLIYDIYNILHR